MPPTGSSRRRLTRHSGSHHMTLSVPAQKSTSPISGHPQNGPGAVQPASPAKTAGSLLVRQALALACRLRITQLLLALIAATSVWPKATGRTQPATEATVATAVTTSSTNRNVVAEIREKGCHRGDALSDAAIADSGDGELRSDCVGHEIHLLVGQAQLAGLACRHIADRGQLRG